MQTICLAMIIKNESKVLRRCLDSVKGKVSTYAIFDTGSSREEFLEQQKIILDVLGVNGSYSQVEWEGFAGSRNHALRMARGAARYILSLDADETLEGDIPELTEPLYSIAVTNDGKTMNWRELLLATSCPATWDGDIHEHLVSIHKPVKLEGCVIKHWHDGKRSDTPETLHGDRTAILEAMNKCSTDDEWERLCFMLGDTYIMDKKYGPAIELYESMADGMDNRRELVWNAIYRMGILREMKCDDHHRIVASYQRAIDTRPYRIEPYLALSEYLKESDPEKAIDLATKAQAIQPPPDTFNVDVSVYSEEYKSKFLAHIKEKK